MSLGVSPMERAPTSAVVTSLRSRTRAWLTRDVVDQLGAAAVDPGEAPLEGDSEPEVPQPLGVALVGLREPGRADLRPPGP